jgi:hypothetical protein
VLVVQIQTETDFVYESVAHDMEANRMHGGSQNAHLPRILREILAENYMEPYPRHVETVNLLVMVVQ